MRSIQELLNAEIDINIVNVREGSVLLTLELPKEYVERVLSHIDKGPILWDITLESSESPGRNRGFSNSPLKYILSQPPLAWGWYILLGMAVLYLIFRAKRRQRVIPVLEKNENTSLEFINTIGRLYFIQNNHRQLALEKMKLFLGFIREHYHLPTREINDAFKKQLIVKAKERTAAVATS